ncbi:hypothetical protein EV652_103629 [Kribbella steppae]|uniref:Uncharacterized protein n=1 Tax=Kribbella steppae TaxID=2512223 RepID=A0A4R2HRB3_9ACTN|nr:hypothetical protein [Kribbella steppae]TCO33627.1 hypothetical protein EV652_103629 [Kribbella steppae]
MSADREGTVTEVRVPQGTRTNEGDLVIGLGGVLLDPLRAMLSVSDRSRRDQLSSDVTLAVGDETQYGAWTLELLDIQPAYGVDVARIAVRTAETR